MKSFSHFLLSAINPNMPSDIEMIKNNPEIMALQAAVEKKKEEKQIVAQR